MILKYELKKVFSKKMNRIVLIAALLAAVALSAVSYTHLTLPTTERV